ncbi:hypothetical protein [Candidatus Liberibacter solanacearum]|uniref:hypothetical protein n=1 Tax=Candidatus Liberibacter solanacearum TaxID=556287 RepID=UPI00387DC141
MRKTGLLTAMTGFLLSSPSAPPSIERLGQAFLMSMFISCKIVIDAQNIENYSSSVLSKLVSSRCLRACPSFSFIGYDFFEEISSSS